MFSQRLEYTVEAMRPSQWIKNTLLFVALVFSGNLTDTELFARAVLAFIIFSVVSGTIYIINDLRDAPRDKVHPLKSQRPIAAGRLSPTYAWTTVVLLSTGSFISAFLLAPSFGIITLVYFVLFVLYTYFLQPIIIINILIVALGFVIRTLAGAFAIGVESSPWMLLCVLFLALFLTLGKRRRETILLSGISTEDNEVPGAYGSRFLDQSIALSAASTLIAYFFLATTPDTMTRLGTDGLKYTTIFVLYGILRYLYIIYATRRASGGKADLIKDAPSTINLAFWLTAVIIIIYH